MAPIHHPKTAGSVLTVNSGSSSIKFALYAEAGAGERLLRGEVRDIGQGRGRVQVHGPHVGRILEREHDFADHAAALGFLLGWLAEQGLDRGVQGVGHRVVHGGRNHHRPERVTPSLLEELRRLVPLVPEHLPHEIAAMEALAAAHPGIPQVACFDTMFHRSMPPVAQRYALPRSLEEDGVIRYGFHGLSYEYVMEALPGLAGPEAARGRVIIAHLGHGASMAAVHRGRCMDTTMGLTPAGGLVMSTRTGDLDPGVLLYLLRERGMTPDQMNTLVNRRSGLLGVSGRSGDMEELLALEAGDPRAREAVDLFCYQARKYVGALAAALGGLETLVFTGGIGQNAPAVRARICDGLGFLGVALDPEANLRNADRISRRGAAVEVRIVAADEERILARHVREVLETGPAPPGPAPG